MESRIFSQVRGAADAAAITSNDYVPVEQPIDEFILRQFEITNPRWLDENRWAAEETLSGIQQGGIETLAWYTSFRSSHVWGIFIRRSAIRGFTYQFATKTGNLRSNVYVPLPRLSTGTSYSIFKWIALTSNSMNLWQHIRYQEMTHICNQGR